jgi:hypothetical protein
MQHRVIAISGSIVFLSLLLAGSAAAGPAARRASHPAFEAEPITIQSWLLGYPDKNGLSGTVKACFKLSGALADKGGEPHWTDSTYADVTATQPADKCGAWSPVGGFVFVPGVKTTDTMVYAVHTITGQKGQLFITFSGTYDLAKTYQGNGAWVITGGTGAYAGLQGEGTWVADASHFPYIRHTETGQLFRHSSI